MEEHQHNYLLKLAYDGTEYGGWQVQPNRVTIQEKLQQSIRIIIKETVKVSGSGRTDAGVHALEQYANFKTVKPVGLQRFIASINGILPQDIRVLDVQEVPLDFHARYSAIGKEYHYHLSLEPVQMPFNGLYCWHIRRNFDLQALKRAAKQFVGEHDFTSFANEPQAGSVAKNPVRNLYRLDVVPEEGGVRLEFEADGFLYKMVRNIVGTLYEVAIGKRNANDIPKLFESCDRREAGKAAPPTGLFLVKVNYKT